jgi:uroporphyrinogen-III synthase
MNNDTIAHREHVANPWSGLERVLEERSRQLEKADWLSAVSEPTVRTNITRALAAKERARTALRSPLAIAVGSMLVGALLGWVGRG